MIPARFVLPDSDRLHVGGTAWSGEAVLGPALRIAWHWSPFETLTHAAFAADWHMTGGDTDLAGLVLPGRHTLRLLGVSGQADGVLLGAAFADAPVNCHFLAQVDLRELRVGGDQQMARGTLHTTPVHCAANAAASIALDLPALRGSVGDDRGGMGSTGALVTIAAQQHLAELRLSRGGALSLWATAPLVARVPLLAEKRLDTAVIW